MDKEFLIENLKTFLSIINNKYPIKLAYLFGSMARGDNNPMSDIDLAILFKDIYEDMEEAFIVGEIVDLANAKFKTSVDVVSMNKASVFLKYSIVKEGIILINCDEKASIESLILREYFDFKYYSDIYDNAFIARLKNKGQNEVE